MTVLTIKIDTDDLGIDEEGYGATFEELFHNGLKDEIAKTAFDKLLNSGVGNFSDLVKSIVSSSVESRIIGLLTEDIKITGKWGEKKFIGSVEDYIKKEIDGRYLHQVGSNGKKLEGCSTSDSENTWINWKLKEYMDNEFKHQIDRAQSKINNLIKQAVDTNMNAFADRVIQEKTHAKLLELGVKIS